VTQIDSRAVITRLKYERLRRGLKIIDIAAAAKVGSSDLGKIERGQYVPPPGSVVLARVARFLDVPVADLLRPVEIVQNAPVAPLESPARVPAIQPIDDGPTAHQLDARRRQEAEERASAATVGTSDEAKR
jgi:transcriptional regulator with XRE-family HTH domain